MMVRRTNVVERQVRSSQGRLILAAGGVLASCLALLFGYALWSIRGHDWQRVCERVQRMGGERAIVGAAMRLRADHGPRRGETTSIIKKESLDWPELFADGGVEEVEIGPDSVLLNLGHRMYLLGFEEGVAGYGTRRITDRLWYWGGEESGLKQRRK